MNRLTPLILAGTLAAGYLAGSVATPFTTVFGQASPPLQGALPPGDYSKMSLSPDQGEPMMWSAESMKKAHTEMIARAARGQGGPNQRDLFPPNVTRTHSYIIVHRPAANPAVPPSIEIHEGATDVYFVVGGSGTVTVGGEVEGKRVVRPGEYSGTLKAGGKQFKLKTGDILNIPPNMVHSTVPDAPDGMTYVLMKVNVGLYPWSLINGTP